MSDFDGFHILAFAIGVVCTAAVALTLFFVFRRRLAKPDLIETPVKAKERNGASKAWEDPEKGEVTNHMKADTSVLQLCDSLRALLEDEKLTGVHRTADLSACMARLEKQVAELSQSESSKVAEAMPPVGLRGAAAVNLLEVDTDGRPLKESFKSTSAETRTPCSSDRSGSSGERDTEELPGVVAMPPEKHHEYLQGEAPLPPLPPAALEPKDRPWIDPQPQKAFGPTNRQNLLRDPPEKSPFVDEEEGDWNSMATLRRVLQRRDVQTSELHKQLRDARKQLWQQSQDSRHATARLHSYLSDTSQAPRAQAEAIQRLQEQVADLSERLGEARHQEQHWQSIAKRQRAFFQQSERMSPDFRSLLKRSPAGEIFLAPPPVLLDDDESPRDEPMWDVGTSHCNPYMVDSWPAEPNVLAARASAPPNLHRWQEGDEDDYDEDDEDEEDEDHVLHGWGRQDRRQDEHDEEDEEDGAGWGEADEPMQRHGGKCLPPLQVPGSDTARSL